MEKLKIRKNKIELLQQLSQEVEFSIDLFNNSQFRFFGKDIQTEAEYQACTISAVFFSDVGLFSHSAELYTLSEEFLNFKEEPCIEEKIGVMLSRANSLKSTNDKHQSLFLVNKVIDSCKQDLKKFELVYANTLILRSNLNFLLNHFQIAKSDLDIALSILQKKYPGKDRRKAMTLYMLAKLQHILENYEEVQFCLDSALQNYEDKEEPDYTYLDSLFLKARVAIKQNNLKLAEQALTDSLNICVYQRNPSNDYIVRIYVLLCIVYKEMKLYKKSVQFAERAEKQVNEKSAENICLRCIALSVLGLAYSSQNYKKAFFYYKKASRFIRSETGANFQLKMFNLELFYTLLRELNEFGSSLKLINYSIRIIEDYSCKNHLLTLDFKVTVVEILMLETKLVEAIEEAKAVAEILKPLIGSIRNPKRIYNLLKIFPEALEKRGSFNQARDQYLKIKRGMKRFKGDLERKGSVSAQFFDWVFVFCYIDLARIYHKLLHYQKAHKMAVKAYNLSLESQDPVVRAESLKIFLLTYDNVFIKNFHINRSKVNELIVYSNREAYPKEKLSSVRYICNFHLSVGDFNEALKVVNLGLRFLDKFQFGQVLKDNWKFSFSALKVQVLSSMEVNRLSANHYLKESVKNLNEWFEEKGNSLDKLNAVEKLIQLIEALIINSKFNLAFDLAKESLDFCFDVNNGQLWILRTRCKELLAEIHLQLDEGEKAYELAHETLFDYKELLGENSVQTQSAYKRMVDICSLYKPGEEYHYMITEE